MSTKFRFILLFVVVVVALFAALPQLARVCGAEYLGSYVGNDGVMRYSRVFTDQVSRETWATDTLSGFTHTANCRFEVRANGTIAISEVR